MTSFSPAPTALVIHPSVRAALRIRAPVVALESAILTHGLAHPTNLSTALALSSTIQSHGAVPATIALINGRPHIGLTPTQLKLLCTPQSSTTSHSKLALRDLPLAFATALTGGTTVSATLHLAHLAGIHVFATGGIGGVHRHVASTLDISADLPALARFPLLVVCAGAKSILHLPHTLQALETASVPVLVLRSSNFPAFYLPSSGLPAPAIIQHPHQAAAVLHASRAAGLSSAVLLAVPLPDRFLPDANLVQTAIDNALVDLDLQRPPVRPNQVTPFLLARVAHRSKGASVRTNVHLVRNNAIIATHAAIALARAHGWHGDKIHLLSPSLDTQLHGKLVVSNDNNSNGFHSNISKHHVLVFGTLALDITAQQTTSSAATAATVPGNIRTNPGGVGFNVALAAARFTRGLTVTLVTPRGTEEDALTDVLTTRVKAELARPSAGHLVVKTLRTRARTPACAVLLDHRGDLVTGVADMDVDTKNREKDGAHIRQTIHAASKNGTKFVILDGNLSDTDLSVIANCCMDEGLQLWIEPTSVTKAIRLAHTGIIARASYLSPNERELCALATVLGDDENKCDEYETVDEISLRKYGKTILQHAEVKQTLVVTRGARGVTRLQLDGNEVIVREFAAMTVVGGVRSTTGAGDCFAGACVGALASGKDMDEAIRDGLVAAAASCSVEEAVAPVALAKL